MDCQFDSRSTFVLASSFEAGGHLKSSVYRTAKSVLKTFRRVISSTGKVSTLEVL